MTENVQHYINQISLARTEIKNLRQQISALKHEHVKEIVKIKSALDSLRCGSCGDTATRVVTNHNEEPSTSNGDTIPYKPIGVIETTFQCKRAVPRQPTVLGNTPGTLIIDNAVFNNPEHALMGLEEFSHIWIIFHFHMTESNSVPAKVSPPRLAGERRGVFSTRSPHRPCPIGLSLVKIQSIEDNKITFLGVDMVNGTPVLDIKPYIPQYDCPATAAELTSPRTEGISDAARAVARNKITFLGVDMVNGTPVLDIKPYIPQYDCPATAAELTRPRTEGISDAADSVARLNLGDEAFDGRSVSPRITHPIGIDTSSPSRSPFEDIPSPGTNILTPISPSPESPLSEDLLNPRTPTRRPDERGAPDGQERFTPPTNLTTNDGIRVASWISNPPSQVYEVRFTDDALNRLNELIGDRAQAFKDNIESLLSEDPRSQYVRTRYPDHEYSCVLEDLSISCVFDASSTTCTIIALRSAEEMQTG